MCHEEPLAALYHVIPAQAGIQASTAYSRVSAHQRHATAQAVVRSGFPAFAGTTPKVKLMPKAV